MRRMLLILALFLLAACQPVIINPPTPIIITATPGWMTNTPVPVLPTNTPGHNPTPTLEGCDDPEYPEPPLVAMNRNPCLLGSPHSTTGNGVSQVFPDGFALFSSAVAGNGFPDRYSAHAEISYDPDGYTIHLRRGAEGSIDGEWGVITEPNLFQPGCYFDKTKSWGRITLRTGAGTADNFWERVVLSVPGAAGRFDLGKQAVTLQGQNIHLRSFVVDSAMMLQVQNTFGANWAVATADSTYTFALIALVYDPSGGHCNASSPHVR